MQKTIQQSIKINTNGVLEIHSGELCEGDVVDVTVSIRSQNFEEKPFTNMIGKAKGCYESPKEVVEFIRQER